MKRFLHGVLLVTVFILLAMSMEEPMAKLMDEDVRQAKVLKPANTKGAREGQGATKTGENKPLTGVKAGGGVGTGVPFIDALTSAIAAANTNGGGQWLSVNGEPAPQPDYVNIKKPNKPAPNKPAWLDTLTSAIAAANTNGGGQWFTPDGTPAPLPAFATNTNRPVSIPNREDQQKDTYDSYRGQPVNESMSDLLRSLRPVLLGNSNVSLSDTLRTIAAGTPIADIPMNSPTPRPVVTGGGTGGYLSRRATGGGGFGSQYSGWSDGGGSNYDSAPAWWNAYLRLNNWNI